MKQTKLMPRIVAPVSRNHWANPSLMNAIAPATYCDLATKQCYPFAGDSAE